MFKVLAPAVAVAAAALVVANPASAKFYIFGSGMWTSVEDAEVKSGGLTGTLEGDDGWGVAGGIGYIIGPHLRSELELSYRKNDLTRLSVNAFGTTASGAATGDVTVFSGMLNAIYDIVTWNRLTPYIGGGVGFGDIDVDVTVAGTRGTGSDTALAYQGLAGIKFAVNQQIDLKIGYRYFALADVTIGSTEGEYDSHNFEFGFSFKF